MVPKLNVNTGNSDWYNSSPEPPPHISSGGCMVWKHGSQRTRWSVDDFSIKPRELGRENRSSPSPPPPPPFPTPSVGLFVGLPLTSSKDSSPSDPSSGDHLYVPGVTLQGLACIWIWEKPVGSLCRGARPKASPGLQELNHTGCYWGRMT
jgi:hypothetical protein